MAPTVDICRAELFTKEEELRGRYPAQTVDKLLRVREMYNWMLANPDAADKDFVAAETERHDIHRTTAYADLAVVKTLLPALGASSREFHRWRTNEMLLATYKMAAKRNDPKTMERAASAYGRLNGVDREDEVSAEIYARVPTQPFTATADPRVLGIEPIPDIDDKITRMIEKYRRETIDIDDIEFEEVDLELGELYPLESGERRAESGENWESGERRAESGENWESGERRAESGEDLSL